jgi:uncharacterized protein YigE (DUF2233 family)
VNALFATIASLVTLSASTALAAQAAFTWKTLQDGLEYAAIGEPAERVHVVRIDPSRAPVIAVMAKAGDKQPRTAARWGRERGLVVAINLGMYQTDHLTNVGHAHAPGHVNNGHWSSSYKSVLAFAPSKKDLPGAVLLDLDVAGNKERLADYGAAVQNLRLIRAPGRNVWTRQERRWSEAAVAMDKQGRILFIFSRAPSCMHDFNNKLLTLPLDITTAMHVEGGPEASLSIHGGGIDLDLNGSYETSFNENDDEPQQWPIPNVLGVARK